MYSPRKAKRSEWFTTEMAATGCPSRSARKNPAGSVVKKAWASSNPGFQPSRAAQSTIMATSLPSAFRIMNRTIRLPWARIVAGDAGEPTLSFPAAHGCNAQRACLRFPRMHSALGRALLDHPTLVIGMWPTARNPRDGIQG